MTDREKFEAWFDKKKQEMMLRGVPTVKVISICKLQWSAWQAALVSQQPADDDGWIEWSGGELPVDFNCAVEVKLRSGSSYEGWMAKNFNWNHTGAGLDIIAYRVVKP